MESLSSWNWKKNDLTIEACNKEDTFIIIKGIDRDSNEYVGRLTRYPDSLALPVNNTLVYNKNARKFSAYLHESYIRSIQDMFDNNTSIVGTYVRYNDTVSGKFNIQNLSFYYYGYPGYFKGSKD